jgi:hypothetical protein
MPTFPGLGGDEGDVQGHGNGHQINFREWLRNVVGEIVIPEQLSDEQKDRAYFVASGKEHWFEQAGHLKWEKIEGVGESWAGIKYSKEAAAFFAQNKTYPILVQPADRIRNWRDERIDSDAAETLLRILRWGNEFFVTPVPDRSPHDVVLVWSLEPGMSVVPVNITPNMIEVTQGEIAGLAPRALALAMKDLEQMMIRQVDAPLLIVKNYVQEEMIGEGEEYPTRRGRRDRVDHSQEEEKGRKKRYESEAVQPKDNGREGSRERSADLDRLSKEAKQENVNNNNKEGHNSRTSLGISQRGRSAPSVVVQNSMVSSSASPLQIFTDRGYAEQGNQGGQTAGNIGGAAGGQDCVGIGDQITTMTPFVGGPSQRQSVNVGVQMGTAPTRIMPLQHLCPPLRLMSPHNPLQLPPQSQQYYQNRFSGLLQPPQLPLTELQRPLSLFSGRYRDRRIEKGQGEREEERNGRGSANSKEEKEDKKKEEKERTEEKRKREEEERNGKETETNRERDRKKKEKERSEEERRRDEESSERSKEGNKEENQEKMEAKSDAKDKMRRTKEESKEKARKERKEMEKREKDREERKEKEKKEKEKEEAKMKEREETGTRERGRRERETERNGRGRHQERSSSRENWKDAGIRAKENLAKRLGSLNTDQRANRGTGNNNRGEGAGPDAGSREIGGKNRKEREKTEREELLERELAIQKVQDALTRTQMQALNATTLKLAEQVAKLTAEARQAGGGVGAGVGTAVTDIDTEAGVGAIGGVDVGIGTGIGPKAEAISSNSNQHQTTTSCNNTNSGLIPNTTNSNINSNSSSTPPNSNSSSSSSNQGPSYKPNHVQDGIGMEWAGILKDMVHPPEYPSMLAGIAPSQQTASSTGASLQTSTAGMQLSLLRVAKQLAVEETDKVKDKVGKVINQDHIIGEPHALTFNTHTPTLTRLPASGTVPEFIKAVMQNVSTVLDPDLIKVTPTYQQAVKHRDKWFVSRVPQHVDKVTATSNEILEIERTEMINLLMDTANRSLNVMEAIRADDMITAFLRAADVYFTASDAVSELKARKVQANTGKGRVLALRHGQLTMTGQGIAGLENQIERSMNTNPLFFQMGGGGMVPASQAAISTGTAQATVIYGTSNAAPPTQTTLPVPTQPQPNPLQEYLRAQSTTPNVLGQQEQQQQQLTQPAQLPTGAGTTYNYYYSTLQPQQQQQQGNGNRGGRWNGRPFSNKRGGGRGTVNYNQ